MSEAENGAAPKAARIVSTKEREKVVPLEYPIEFDGKTWEAVTVRRVTGRQIEEYMDAIARKERVPPPMIECPLEVYDAMDDDDRLAVDEAVIPFLPRRLRAAAEAVQSLQAGEGTSGS